MYQQYRNYFQALRQGKVVAEPDSTRKDRAALMDMIWECLVKWEAAGGPEDLLDGSFSPGGRPVTQVEELYVMGFNDLRKSCRLYRQQDGPRGYVKYVQEWIAEMLDDSPSFRDLLDPDVPVQDGWDFDYLLEKRNYKITLNYKSTGDAAVDALIYEDGNGKEASPEALEALLQRFPNNRLLRADYAISISGDKTEDAAHLLRGLVAEAPSQPYFVSSYLNMLFNIDKDLGFEEAERLDFKFDLNAYTFDNEDGYSVTALIAHASVCTKIAVAGPDLPYVFELLDDLLRVGIPEELLIGIAKDIILGVFINSSGNFLVVAELFDEEFDRLPKLSEARAFLESQLQDLLEFVISESELGTNARYPNADPSYPDWPRNPGDVEGALQLRINIVGSDPEIFRTIVVPDDTLLPDLHGMLQVAFDWEESHLHEFVHNGVHFAMPHPDVPSSDEDSRSVRIGQLLKNIGDEMTYVYDFGDNWQHRIVLNALPEVDDEILYPRCIAGARRGPKEDSGGIHNYQRILKIINDPSHAEYEDFIEWLGEDFKPDEFVLHWTHKQLWKGRFWNLKWGMQEGE